MAPCLPRLHALLMPCIKFNLKDRVVKGENKNKSHIQPKRSQLHADLEFLPAITSSQCWIWAWPRLFTKKVMQKALSFMLLGFWTAKYIDQPSMSIASTGQHTIQHACLGLACYNITDKVCLAEGIVSPDQWTSLQRIWWPGVSFFWACDHTSRPGSSQDLMYD